MQKQYPHEIENLAELEKAYTKSEIEEKYVPIPDDEVESTRKMNRKERRKWLSQQRRIKRNEAENEYS